MQGIFHMESLLRWFRIIFFLSPGKIITSYLVSPLHMVFERLMTLSLKKESVSAKPVQMHVLFCLLLRRMANMFGRWIDLMLSWLHTLLSGLAIVIGCLYSTGIWMGVSQMLSSCLNRLIRRLRIIRNSLRV